MYDVKYDPAELKNLASKPSMAEVRARLTNRLAEWQTITNDPWRCAPHGVLQDKGEFKNDPQCMTLNV